MTAAAKGHRIWGRGVRLRGHMACRFSVAACIVLSATACSRNGDGPIVGPTPPPPPPPVAGPATTSSSLTLTGTVVEFTASGRGLPVPNLRLEVRTSGPTGGRAGGVELPDVVTDESGRYTVPDVTALVLYLETAPGSDHRFPCGTWPVEGTLSRGPRLVDYLPVVHATWAGDSLPPGMWWPGTSVYGVVSERTGETLQPVPGATVTLDGGISPATTNAAGFYMICSILGTDQNLTVSAAKSGYRTATREIFGGWEFLADLELVREEP